MAVDNGSSSSRGEPDDEPPAEDMQMKGADAAITDFLDKLKRKK